MRRVGIVLFLLFSGSLCRPSTRPDDGQPPEKPPGDSLPFFVENLSQDTAFSSGLEVAVSSVDGIILGCWYALLSPGVVGQRIFCRIRAGLQWGPIMIVDTGFAFGVAWDRQEGFWMVYQVDRVLGGGTRSAEIFIRHLDATTADWSERVSLSDTSDSTDYASDPWVGVDGMGRVHVVWDDNLNTPRTVYRGNDGTGLGSREEFESGFNRELEMTESGEVWVVQEDGNGNIMLAQRQGKELWEIRRFPGGPGLVNGSLNLDVFEDGDVLVSWQALEDPYHVAILGMLKSRGWVQETLRGFAAMGYYRTTYVGGDTVLMVWSEGVGDTGWVFAGLWTRSSGIVHEQKVSQGFLWPNRPVPYRPVIWADTAFIPFANDHEGNFEVYLIHVPRRC